MENIRLRAFENKKDSIEDYTYFGGNQEWFETKWRRMSGCGPTTASTIIMYEDIKII